MSIERMPVMEKREEESEKIEENEAENIRSLRPIVEQIGGKWQVDGVRGEQTNNETIYAFWVNNEETAVVDPGDPSGTKTMNKGEYMKAWLEGIGYKAYDNKEELEDPEELPAPGMFRMIPEPKQQYIKGSKDEYIFRIAEKKVKVLEEEIPFEKAA